MIITSRLSFSIKDSFKHLDSLEHEVLTQLAVQNGEEDIYRNRYLVYSLEV